MLVTRVSCSPCSGSCNFQPNTTSPTGAQPRTTFPPVDQLYTTSQPGAQPYTTAPPGTQPYTAPRPPKEVAALLPGPPKERNPSASCPPVLECIWAVLDTRASCSPCLSSCSSYSCERPSSTGNIDKEDHKLESEAVPPLVAGKDVATTRYLLDQATDAAEDVLAVDSTTPKRESPATAQNERPSQPAGNIDEENQKLEGKAVPPLFASKDVATTGYLPDQATDAAEALLVVDSTTPKRVGAVPWTPLPTSTGQGLRLPPSLPGPLPQLLKLPEVKTTDNLADFKYPLVTAY